MNFAEINSAEDVCSAFNIAPRTLQVWQSKGIINGRKLGDKTVFTEEDIKRALEKAPRTGRAES